MRLSLCALMLALIVLTSGCTQGFSGMYDGYFTAEMSDFDDYGWKEYITIYVSDNKIVTAEFNGFNRSGFLRTWDMDYMRIMINTDGTYPNEYRRIYETGLLDWQNPEDVDALSGATHSYYNFELLAKAAIAQARANDKQVALVSAD